MCRERRYVPGTIYMVKSLCNAPYTTHIENISILEIKQKIYTIRGKQVILDSDAARIYHCKTKYVNRVVKRNIERFPEDFCFQLTEEEYDSLRCQFVTLKNQGRGQHRKYLPYAFTEHGIAMLSVLIDSEIAVKVSVNIMKAFIEMRKFLILDKKYIYHIGASLKDLGKKCFGITLIKYDAIIEDILSKLDC